jgi:uncharacterized membrane protein YccF (DUF307 family)
MSEPCVWPFSKRIIDVPAVSTKENITFDGQGKEVKSILPPSVA